LAKFAVRDFYPRIILFRVGPMSSHQSIYKHLGRSCSSSYHMLPHQWLT
jgi:hypothetical protein